MRRTARGEGMGVCLIPHPGPTRSGTGGMAGFEFDKYNM
jgi:hypothetical protein